MKSKTETRRCSECNKPFEPDPRTKARQVTCGSELCQRLRHAEMCRVWRQKNPEFCRDHYEDVIVAFRARNPAYQRWWRWKSKLCEIREEINKLYMSCIPRTKRLLAQGQKLSTVLTQVPENAAKMVKSAPAIVSAIGSLMHQLQVLVEALELP